MIALLSEYTRLTPLQQSAVTYIILDDGNWSSEQIRNEVARISGILPEPDFDRTNWTHNRPL